MIQPAPELPPPSEAEAFDALTYLENQPAPEPVPAGPARPRLPSLEAYPPPVSPVVAQMADQRAAARSTLETYVRARKAKNLPLFPAKAAEAYTTQTRFLADLYSNPLETVLPAEDLGLLNSAAAASGDPEAFKIGQINRTFLSTIVGKPLEGESYAHTRDLYANQHLGLVGPVTDQQFHGAVAARVAEESAASKTMAKLIADNTGFILQGGPEDRQAANAQISMLPERLRQNAKETYFAAIKDAREAVRRNRPLVAKLESLTAQIAGTKDPAVSSPDAIANTAATLLFSGQAEAVLGENIDAMAALLPDNLRERAIALELLRTRLQKLPEDQRGTLARIATGINRGIQQGGDAIKDVFRGGVRSLAGVMPKGQNNATAYSDDTQTRAERRAELLSVIQGDGMKLTRADDSYLVGGLVKFAPSAWMLPAALDPLGWAAMAVSMAGQSFMDARIRNPDADEGLQLNAAIASGAVQGVLEGVFNLKGIQIATGKLPTLTRLLTKAGLENKAARFALGATAGAGIIEGQEYVEEALQSGTDKLLQAAATDLSGIDENQKWGAWAHDWALFAGQDQRDVLQAVLPLALIGGGGAGVSHFRNAAVLIRNKALLRASGIAEPEILSILTAPTPEAAEAAFKGAWEAAQERLANSPEERAKAATAKAAFVADFRASNAAKARANLAQVTTERDDFTGEDQYVFTDYTTSPQGVRQIFDTEEAAADAWREAAASHENTALDELYHVSEVGFLEHVMGEGQLAESGVKLDIVSKPLSLAEEQSAMNAEKKAAEEAARKGTTAAKRRAAEDRLEQATSRLAALKARIEIFILDKGLTPDAAADALKNTFIRGRVTADQIGNAIVGHTVQLFAGREFGDVVEEFSEANLRNAVLDGLVDPEIMLDDIRRYEQATGRQVIDPGYEYDPANPLPLTEGFSKLARGFIYTEVRSGTLPESVRQWAEMQALIASVMVRNASDFAADVETAGDLREAIAAGHLPPRLQRMIADSVGLSESNRMYRLQKREEEQLAAEAMGGFPEIQDTLRGRLPHPATARKNNLPLVGELKRIYDALVRPTRRKTKTGKAIDRTNEANAYFLPEGQVESLDLVRRDVNQRGFDFLTPADMLDALDVSISYGKPQYGTMSQMNEGESYSLAQGSGKRVRLNALYPVELTQEQRADVIRRLRKIGVTQANAEALLNSEKTVDAVVNEQLPVKDLRISENENGSRTGWFDGLLGDDSAVNIGTLAHDAAMDYGRSQAAEKIGLIIGPLFKFGWEGKPVSNVAQNEADRISAQMLAKAQAITDESLDGKSDSYVLTYLGPEDTEIWLEAEAAAADERMANLAIIDAGKSSSGESWSLSFKGIIRLEEAIARKMTQGPEERADYYQRLRDRLAARVLMLRETKRHTAVDQTEAEEERNRIESGLAEAQAIIAALPAEARGRVNFPIADVLAADTERGQVNALLRLIDKADAALEIVLLKEYREAYETLLDLAKPDLRQNKTLRGRLTPEAQRLVGLIQEAMVMDEAAVATKIVGTEAEIAAIEAETPQTPEEVKAAQARLDEASIRLNILTTHGALATLDAAQTAAAYEDLLATYTSARTTRKILDEAKQAELKAARQEVIDSLPSTDQAKHAEKVNAAGILDNLHAFGLGLVSFHQLMERIFPKSQTARKFQEDVRTADRAFTRAKIDAHNRFRSFVAAAWGITGRAATWKTNQIVGALSTARENWGVEIVEGIVTTEEKLTEDQAAAILAGTMKVGWETDPIAMLSLSQALADFRLQRLKAQNEDKRFSSTVIRFKRVTKRGNPGPLLMSDLEVLYILQLWAQEQYRPALDKYGFTEQVIATLEKKLDPRAEDLGNFLRGEYDAEWDRLNPVYRRRFGMDMPKIRNYAPGTFQHNNASSGNQITPEGAAPPVNAMAAGFTKARTHHLARPEKVNAMAKFWIHLEATEYFIAFSDVLSDARSVFRNPEVRRRLESAYGEKVTSLFHQWLDALELDGQFRAADTLANKAILAKLMNTQSAVGLAYNIGVLFKQVSATLGFLMEMNSKDALHGLANLNVAAWRAVWDSEAVQQRILSGVSPEDRQLLSAASASPSVMLHALAVGRVPIAYADALFTATSGAIAYAHAEAAARKDGLNPDQAAARKDGLNPDQAAAVALEAATRVIERTAQPATTQDKSMAELSAGALGKLMFMFKSDPRRAAAYVGTAYGQLRRGKIKAPEFFRKFFWGWVVYGLLNEVMTDSFQAMTREDDDPERWSWKDYLAGGIAGPLNAIPFYGTVGAYGLNKVFGTKAYGNSVNPLDSAGENAARLAGKITDAFGDGKELTVQNWLTLAQQTTASLSVLAGGFDSRSAIVPATLRVIRDSWGLASNAIDAVLPDSPEEQAAAIIREVKATEAKTGKENTRTLDALAKELGNLDTAARTARLANLDSDTRKAVTDRLRKSRMTPSEQALANMSKATRAAAVEKILAALPESRRESYLANLQDLDLAE